MSRDATVPRARGKPQGFAGPSCHTTRRPGLVAVVTVAVTPL